MSRRRMKALDLGEAISFDSVLTILTVLLVLRVVFLVPMVNLDKAKTVAAEKDQSLTVALTWVMNHASAAQRGDYDGVLSAIRPPAVVTMEGDVRWVEALLPESTLVVIRHDLRTQEFNSLRTQSSSVAPSYRHGKLLWSETEKQWFASEASVDYGDAPASQTLSERYRTLTASRKGTP